MCTLSTRLNPFGLYKWEEERLFLEGEFFCCFFFYRAPDFCVLMILFWTGISVWHIWSFQSIPIIKIWSSIQKSADSFRLALGSQRSTLSQLCLPACYLYFFLSCPSPGWKRSPAGCGLQIELTWALALPFTCHVSCNSNNLFHTNAQTFLKPAIWNTQALLLCVNDGLNTFSGPNIYLFFYTVCMQALAYLNLASIWE